MATVETIDSRSDAEKAATSHVDNWTPPEESDAVQVESPVEVGDLKLPGDLKKSHSILQETLASAPANYREAQVKTAKLRAIRDHIFQLEQGAKLPVLQSQHYQAIASSQSAHADALHLFELSRLHPEVKALMDKNESLEKQLAAVKKSNK